MNPENNILLTGDLKIMKCIRIRSKHLETYLKQNGYK